jgi:hypothetical protein
MKLKPAKINDISKKNLTVKKGQVWYFLIHNLTALLH